MDDVDPSAAGTAVPTQTPLHFTQPHPPLLPGLRAAGVAPHCHSPWPRPPPSRFTPAAAGGSSLHVPDTGASPPTPARKETRLLALQHVFGGLAVRGDATREGKRLWVLGDYLAAITGRPKQELHRADDPKEYRVLLATAVVGIPPGAKEFRSSESHDAFVGSTMSEIVHRVINSLFAASLKPAVPHVLCFGYRRVRDQAACLIPGIFGVENHFPNTLVNSLCSSKWELLLFRIGEEAMTYILTHACVFIALRNYCFYQLTGPPLADLTGTCAQLDVPYTATAKGKFRPSLHKLDEICRRRPETKAAVSPAFPRDTPGTVCRTRAQQRKLAPPTPTSNADAGEESEERPAVDREIRVRRQRRKAYRTRKRAKENAHKANASAGTSHLAGEESVPKPAAADDRSRNAGHGQLVKSPADEAATTVEHQGRMCDERSQKRVHSAAYSQADKPCSGRARKRRRVHLGSTESVSTPLETTPTANSLPSAASQVLFDRLELHGAEGEGEPMEAESDRCQTPPVVTAGHFAGNGERPGDGAVVQSRGNPRVLNNPRTEKRISPSYSTSNLSLLRSKIFYARPVRTCRGEIASGLPKTHILNRCRRDLVLELRPPTPGMDAANVALRHVFPRQFGLSNVFVCRRDMQATTGFADARPPSDEDIARCRVRKVPWRLRPFLRTLDSLIRRHRRCHYAALLRRHCPVEVLDSGTQAAALSQEENASENMAQHFNTYSQVVSFIRAVFRRIVPMDLWGSQHNQNVVLDAVGKFVALRKYEKMTIHEVMQGFKLNDCQWLQAGRSSKQQHHDPPSEGAKQNELICDVISWIFDSLLVPLIRTNFYVTESQKFRNKVFYFRQDLWSRVIRTTLSRMSGTIFKEMDEHEALTVLLNRRIQFSYVRLLPKERGVRPIVNLRRRALVTPANGGHQNGPKVLGPSINSILQNVFQVLNFEKSRQPGVLGGSVMGQTDIHQKLKTFKTKMASKIKCGNQLYLAKVDVTGAFNTIDQAKLIDVIQGILLEDEYMVHKVAAVYPSAGRLRRTYMRRVQSADRFTQFHDTANQLCKSFRQAVLIDQVSYSYEQRGALLALLQDHVKNNLIKIGNKFYRQVVGIPQGSVLSTLLCSYFYADMEKEELRFVQRDKEGVLMRYVDDFLYISFSKGHVQRFMEVMTAGHPRYGAFVNPAKTLCNFETAVNGSQVTQTQGTHGNHFPWCGLLINCKTLDVTADYSRYSGLFVNDTLTVETGRNAGKALLNKLVQMVKPRFHVIFIDDDLNSADTILLNIYQNMLLCAMKYHCYVSRLPRQNMTPPRFFIEVVYNFFDFALGILKARLGAHRKHRSLRTRAPVSDMCFYWLCAHAFHRVLQRKQTGHKHLLQSLRLTLCDQRFEPARRRLQGVVAWNRSSVFDNLLY